MSYQNMIPTFTESLSYEEKKKVDTIIEEYYLAGIVRILGALGEYVLKETNSDMCRGVLSFARDLYEEVEPKIAYQAIVKMLTERHYEPVETFIQKRLSLIDNPELTSKDKLHEVKTLLSNLSKIGYLF